MPSPGWTSKPCEGCGTGVEQLDACHSDNVRKKGKLCSACQKLMEMGKELIAARDKERDTELKPFVIGRASHYHQGLFIGSHGRFVSSHETQLDKLPDILHELAMTAGDFDPTNQWWNNVERPENVFGPQSDSGKCQNLIHMDPEVQEIFVRLDTAIRGAMQECYNGGFEHGRDLLGQLAEGEITHEDLVSQDILRKVCPICSHTEFIKRCPECGKEGCAECVMSRGQNKCNECFQKKPKRKRRARAA